MSRGLGNRIPSHSAGFRIQSMTLAGGNLAGPWLQGLNVASPDGAAYRGLNPPSRASCQHLAAAPPTHGGRSNRLRDVTSPMPSHKRVAAGRVDRSYGRRDSNRRLMALEGDVVSTDPRSHEMTAVLDRWPPVLLIARRQDIATIIAVSALGNCWRGANGCATRGRHDEHAHRESRNAERPATVSFAAPPDDLRTLAATIGVRGKDMTRRRTRFQSVIVGSVATLVVGLGSRGADCRDGPGPPPLAMPVVACSRPHPRRRWHGARNDSGA